MVIFEKSWIGKTVGVNKWHGVRAYYNKKTGKPTGHIYENQEYKAFKDSLRDKFLTFNKPFRGPVNLEVVAYLWKMKDSDSFVKPLMDALEDSNIIKNDKQIRDIVIRRRYHKRDELDYLKVRLTSVNTENDDPWPIEVPDVLPSDSDGQRSLFSGEDYEGPNGGNPL